MTDKSSNEQDDSDEDWMKYANAGFGQTDYSLWDEEQSVESLPDDSDDWDDESPDQLSTHTEEISRALLQQATSTLSE